VMDDESGDDDRDGLRSERDESRSFEVHGGG